MQEKRISVRLLAFSKGEPPEGMKIPRAICFFPRLAIFSASFAFRSASRCIWPAFLDSGWNILSGFCFPFVAFFTAEAFADFEFVVIAESWRKRKRGTEYDDFGGTTLDP